MLFQLKQIDKVNKGHNKMDITAAERVLHVSSYPMIASMGLDSDMSDEVANMRSATLLGDIACFHQHTKNSLNYVHTNSKYEYIVAIPAADALESFSVSAREKGWVDKIILHSLDGKEENKVSMTQ